MPPAIPAKKNVSLESLCWSGFIAIGLLLVYGHIFPSEDHFLDIPPIKALLESGLYVNDFAVAEQLAFNPRTYFQKTILFLANLGLQIYEAFFLCYLIAFISLIIGVKAIAKHLKLSVLSFSVLLLWVFFCTGGHIGESFFFKNKAIPSVFAQGIAIWGIYFCIKRKWLLGYGLLGLSSLYQFLIGFLPGLLLLPSLFVSSKKQDGFKSLVGSLCLWGTGLAFVYVPIIIQEGVFSNILSSKEFVSIYGFIRHPHHVIPSQWGVSAWIELILFYIGGLLCLKKTQLLESSVKRSIASVVGAAFVLLIINFIFVEIFPLALIAKLQFARVTPFAQFAVLIGLVALFEESCRKKHFLVCTLLPVILISTHPGVFLLLFAFSLEPLRLFKSTPCWPLVALLVLGFLHVGYTFGSIVHALRILLVPAIILIPLGIDAVLKSPKGRLGFSAACFLVAFWGTTQVLGSHFTYPLFKIGSHRVEFHTGYPPGIKALALAAKEYTPKESIFLIPPAWELQAFKFHSERSVVVDFKNFPYTQNGIREWKQRMDTVLGHPIDSPFNIATAYASRTEGALLSVAKKYKADYIVSKAKWHPNMSGDLVLKLGDWSLWKIN